MNDDITYVSHTGPKLPDHGNVESDKHRDYLTQKSGSWTAIHILSDLQSHPTPSLWGKMALLLLDSGEGDELGHGPSNSSVGHDSQRVHKMSVVAWETNQAPGWL